MLEIVITLLLAVHLLCVNVASGGPIVAAWLDWRGTRGDEAAARAAAYLARWSLIGLVAGAALGLAIGWLKWSAAYSSLWTGPLSYKLHWAVVEAIFSLLLLVGWWLWLPGRAGGTSAPLAARCAMAVLASTNLLYHFPLLFSVAARLVDAGAVSGEQIGGAAFRRLMVQGDTPALAVHVCLASIAVAGIMLLGLALRWFRQGDEASASKMARWGGRWAFGASVAQLPVGLWTLMLMPADAQSRWMGESAVGTLLFVAALVAAVWLISDLAHIALGEVTRPLIMRAMAAMTITVVLMTAMQHQARLRSESPRENQAGSIP